MSKSVLVVNTPRKCIGCQFFKSTYSLHCILASGNIEDIESKPDWCPLKPLPEKNTTENDMTDYQCGMVDGRNQCIDEITGGNSDD